MKISKFTDYYCLDKTSSAGDYLGYKPTSISKTSNP